MSKVSTNTSILRTEDMLSSLSQSLGMFSSSTEFLQKVLDTIPQKVFWKDRDSKYLGCNQLFADVAGLNSPRQIVGLNDFDLPWSYEESVFYRTCDQRIMAEGKAEIGIVESQVKNEGNLTWVETNKVPLSDDQGEVIGILGTFHDITKLKEAEHALQRSNEDLERRVNERTKELKYVADHDALTGLSNRRCFTSHLEKSVNHQSLNNEFALLFIDLDHFKPINDSEGHAAGDSLLVQVAEILSAEISDQDVAGRFGGDEFLVLLKDVSDTQSIFDLCDRILDGFSKQVFLNKRHVAVTASLGLVFSKQTDYQSADQVLRDADRRCTPLNAMARTVTASTMTDRVARYYVEAQVKSKKAAVFFANSLTFPLCLINVLVR